MTERSIRKGRTLSSWGRTWPFQNWHPLDQDSFSAFLPILSILFNFPICHFSKSSGEEGLNCEEKFSHSLFVSQWPDPAPTPYAQEAPIRDVADRRLFGIKEKGVSHSFSIQLYHVPNTSCKSGLKSEAGSPSSKLGFSCPTTPLSN